MKLLSNFALLPLLAAPALAQDGSPYTITLAATSNTAMAVTGDVVMDDFSVEFADGTVMEFSDLVGDTILVDGVEAFGSIYEMAAPEDPILLNDNQLCGMGDVTYLAAYAAGDGMTEIAVFTTQDVPASTEDACAIYLYEDVY